MRVEDNKGWSVIIISEELYEEDFKKFIEEGVGYIIIYNCWLRYDSAEYVKQHADSMMVFDVNDRKFVSDCNYSNIFGRTEYYTEHPAVRTITEDDLKILMEKRKSNKILMTEIEKANNATEIRDTNNNRARISGGLPYSIRSVTIPKLTQAEQDSLRQQRMMNPRCLYDPGMTIEPDKEESNGSE